MKDPKKQLFLLNLFLTKRDEKLGGVNGFVGDFSFNIDEIDEAVISNKADLEDLLTNFKNKLIHFDNKEASILTGYIEESGSYTISGCYTPQIKILKKALEDQLERDSEKPMVYILTTSKQIKKDSKNDNRQIFMSPKQAEIIDNLQDGLLKKADTLLSNRTSSSLQIISREKRLLNELFSNEYGIPDDLIITITRRGYKLNSDKFIFKYLKA